MIGRAALLLLLLLIAPDARAAGGWPDGAAGMLVYREGDVGLAHGGKPSAWLYPHDRLTTGTGARAFILFADGSTLTLGEDGACAVEDGGKRAAHDPVLYLSCSKGSFLYAAGSTARPAARIATRLATIGAGGTVWAGSVDTFGVFAHRGTATLSTGRGRILLKEGQGSLIVSGSAPPSRPAAWPPDRLQAAAASIRIRDVKALATALSRARAMLPASSAAQAGH